MPPRRFSNVVAFDDGPFPRQHAGRVAVVGTVYADLRLDGVLTGSVEKDGTDAADELARLVLQSRFEAHIRLVMLQGIAMAGFNVVDVFALQQHLERPVLVVSRRLPDLNAIKAALQAHIPSGAAKWRIIERLGPMEPAGPVFIQRVGIERDPALETVARFAIHGHVPEPLRSAHLIAGALVEGQSRGNP
ncbi:MAG: DUF99 family protein [Desulfobacterales bacterium]|nr:DUF99 family protein [Desulfobacterales bacterium]